MIIDSHLSLVYTLFWEPGHRILLPPLDWDFRFATFSNNTQMKWIITQQREWNHYLQSTRSWEYPDYTYHCGYQKQNNLFMHSYRWDKWKVSYSFLSDVSEAELLCEQLHPLHKAAQKAPLTTPSLTDLIHLHPICYLHRSEYLKYILLKKRGQHITSAFVNAQYTT